MIGRQDPRNTKPLLHSGKRDLAGDIPTNPNSRVSASSNTERPVPPLKNVALNSGDGGGFGRRNREHSGRSEYQSYLGSRAAAVDYNNLFNDYLGGYDKSPSSPLSSPHSSTIANTEALRQPASPLGLDNCFFRENDQTSSELSNNCKEPSVPLSTACPDGEGSSGAATVDRGALSFLELSFVDNAKSPGHGTRLSNLSMP